jgi:hypothetical protein
MLQCLYACTEELALGEVEVQAEVGAILGDEPQRFANISRRACDDAVVHVPEVQEEIGALCPRGDHFHDAVQDERKQEGAEWVALLYSRPGAEAAEGMR